jgi:hypothetical protein
MIANAQQGRERLCVLKREVWTASISRITHHSSIAMNADDEQQGPDRQVESVGGGDEKLLRIADAPLEDTWEDTYGESDDDARTLFLEARRCLFHVPIAFFQHSASFLESSMTFFTQVKHGGSPTIYSNAFVVVRHLAVLFLLL